MSLTAERGAKLLQSVRKLPTRPKNVAQNSVFDDFSGSDRSEAAKARPDSESAIRLGEFSHGLFDFCTRKARVENDVLRGAFGEFVGDPPGRAASPRGGKR
jgi:hypothetical protein